VRETEIYGADGKPLTTMQKIKLLIEWAPLLGLLQQVAKVAGNQEKALALVAALRWLAEKTDTPNDDKALDHLEAILKTPEGAAIVNFLILLAGALK
jgi:hypothetical protein